MGRKTARDFWINRMTVLDPHDRKKGEGERERERGIKKGRQRERDQRSKDQDDKASWWLYHLDTER